MRLAIASYVIAIAIFAFADEQPSVGLDLPEMQTTQLEAGYPMGCQITSMVYALKFGPRKWRNAYQAILGLNDIQKIQSLALRFSGLPSQTNKDQPAFSDKFGVDPNDLPWMFRTVAPEVDAISSITFARLPGSNIPKPDFLSQLQAYLLKNLSAGKPVMAGLYFSDPDFSHMVLILRVNNGSVADSTLGISVLDPMTGRISEAKIRSGSVVLVGHQVEGLSFDDPSVVNRTGVLLTILQ